MTTGTRDVIRDENWIQTYSGNPFWPLDPRPEEIDIFDIAHALSMTCRYNGHVKKFYSVAEHCFLLSYAVNPENALWALLHDMTEAYLPDLTRPVKRAMPKFRAAENKIMIAGATRFGLSLPEPKEVKEADTRILFNERAVLLSTSVKEWGLTGEPLPNTAVMGLLPTMAEGVFIGRFKQLGLNPDDYRYIG